MKLLRTFSVLLLCFGITSAHAGVRVSIWSPGVVVFDPYTPTYVPAPRPDYVWIPGSYDEYGEFSPGYWQPAVANPGYVWADGYWVGRVYHEGYWRAEASPGRSWVKGYYLGGRYVQARWVTAAAAPKVHASHAARAHSVAKRRAHKAGRKP